VTHAASGSDSLLNKLNCVSELHVCLNSLTSVPSTEVTHSETQPIDGRLVWEGGLSVERDSGGGGDNSVSSCFGNVYYKWSSAVEHNLLLNGNSFITELNRCSLQPIEMNTSIAKAPCLVWEISKILKQLYYLCIVFLF
jgi:hypothetical protein